KNNFIELLSTLQVHTTQQLLHHLPTRPHYRQNKSTMPDPNANATVNPPPNPEPSSTPTPTSPSTPVPDSILPPSYPATSPPSYTETPPDPSTSLPAGAHPCPSCLGSTRGPPCPRCPEYRSNAPSSKRSSTVPIKDLYKVRRESSARARQESLAVSKAFEAYKEGCAGGAYRGSELASKYRDCKAKAEAGVARIAKALQEAERNLHNATLVAGNAANAAVKAGHEKYKAEGEKRRAEREMVAAREAMQRKGQEVLRWGKEKEKCEKEEVRWEKEARFLEKEAQEWEKLRHDWDVASREARLETRDLVESYNQRVARSRATQQERRSTGNSGR
ncbi:uncharacterized protein BDZ99DRAFT_554571, partial [Mytilinidion resinicola]